MARFYPDRPHAEAPRSELRMLQAFAHLDDHWRVFHSVAWQSQRAGRQGDGEADFVLLHPERGALVIEVKGGGVDVRSGTWFTVDRNGTEHRIRNPFEQAVDSKHALVTYLHSLEPPIREIRVGHAVAFPDIKVTEQFGLYGPRAIVLDRDDAQTPAAAIERVVNHWEMRSALSSAGISRFVRLLAPTVRIARRLSDDVADALEEIARLTQEQLRALSLLKRERRAVVAGGAGTGKTILAVERARALALDGFRTALLCYNAPLGTWLAEQLADASVSACTFHALCMQQARAAGLSVPVSPSEEWWEREAPVILVDAASKTGLRFDAIIVDEGQDFSSEWLEALEALLSSPTDAPFYLFADLHQEIFARGFALPTWPRQSLTLNCRNTLPIARRVARVFDESAPIIGATGPDPVFVTARLSRDGRKLVQRIVTRLLEEEALAPDQVVVLSDDTSFLESLRTLLVGNHSFTRIGGKGVVADTIARFKGLESDAVVLCLSNALLDAEPTARSAAYVGLSRARTLLFVVGSPDLQQRLAW